MNERLKERWSQAGGHYNSGNQHTWPQYTIDDPEKFAELIIKECADFVSNDRQHDEYGVFFANRIKQHFGVE